MSDEIEQPRRYENGDHIQTLGDRSVFGVVVYGFREATSGRCPTTGRPHAYVPTPESLARYGYVLTVKWGACAFEDDLMDGKERTKAVHVSKIESASAETSAWLTSMSTDRMFSLQRAYRGAITAHFGCQREPMMECETLGWLRRISADGWGTFEITELGRELIERFQCASRGLN